MVAASDDLRIAFHPKVAVRRQNGVFEMASMIWPSSISVSAMCANGVGVFADVRADGQL